MRALLQRVKKASVEVDSKTVGSIKEGLLVYLGIGPKDTQGDIEKLVTKIARLRIFDDKDGKTNLSLLDIKAPALVVSQFTLYADTKKGNRPSFGGAMKPGSAKLFYCSFVSKLEEELKIKVETGVFGAMMQVHSINDGPFTLILES